MNKRRRYKAKRRRFMLSRRGWAVFLADLHRRMDASRVGKLKQSGVD